MSLHVIKKGLDLPISGEPEQRIEAAKSPSRVALVAADYIGMKPTLLVQEGDTVKRGQALFEDKKTPGVIYTSPGAGKVSAINRGARRAFQTIVIELNENERNGSTGGGDLVAFENYQEKDLAQWDGDQVRALLIESGMWTALRTRPFSKVPATDSKPHSIFINTMDTNPLAPSMDLIAEGRQEDLNAGVLVVSKLCDYRTYFCKAPDSKISPDPNLGATVEDFTGPHPSGTVGVHIHFLAPVSREKTVWHIGLQDVLAIGALFRTGKLDVERIVSLAGPSVAKPRLLRTRFGASIEDITAGELAEGEQRVISGSVLSGRAAMGEVHGYLGRFHNQISVIREGREREFMGWMAPGKEKFSVINTFISKLSPGKKFAFSTTTNGSKRAMVPIGMYEKVMPMDILPTFLLRSLVVNDTDRAEKLGCLELDEEDLALCTFVCPGKYDYGHILRRNLTIIEKEG